MKEQHFRNHIRLSTLYHFITVPFILAIIIGASINLCHANNENQCSALLILALSILAVLLWFFSRNFALKAQDRAIRAEENFRHFILTGKPFDSKLRLGQVIALRFASDGELEGLAKKAVDENLSPKQIKQAIKNWRADNHRV